MSQPEQRGQRVSILKFTSSDRMSPREVIPVVRAVQELYTKCWLISQGRIDDLMRYGQTRDRVFEEEAGVKFQGGIIADTESTAVKPTIFELSVPVTNDPLVLRTVEEAIRTMWDKRPPTP